MRKEDIISKGKYSYSQPENLISVKNYLFVRNEDGKKAVLLRMSNDRNEACARFGFALYQIDAKGKVIGEERFDSTESVSYKPSSHFAFDRQIIVSEKCTNFKIKLLYATYGEYSYKLENNEVTVDFTEKVAVAAVGGRAPERKIKPRKITHRALELPWIYAVLAFFVLAAMLFIVGLQLNNFKENEYEFTLEGVEYEFIDKEENEVVIVGCTEKYENVLIPSEIEGCKVIGIEDGAFKGDNVIKRVRIEGVDIGDEAFEGCENLEEVYLVGVDDIGERAFFECESLKTVSSSGLKRVDDEAFAGCSRLEKVEITGDEKKQTVLKMGELVFADCSRLEKVSIDQVIRYSDDKDIFDGSYAIEELHLGSFCYTIPSIDGYVAGESSVMALFGYPVNTSKVALKTLSIDNIDKIGNEFCSGLENLTTVSINNSVISSIGNEAFMDCESLKNVVLKGSVESIGKYAFANSGIESFDASDTVKIGEGAFTGCKSLKDVMIDTDSPLEEIGSEAFKGCSSLDSVVCPISLVMIGDHAFASSGIKSLSLSENVYVIGDSILEGCKQIETMTIPYLPDNGMSYFFGEGKEGYFGTVSSVPESLSFIKIWECTEISEGAFKNLKGLKKVEFPDGLLSVGAYAFDGCLALEEFEIPATVVSIGDYAFRNSGLLSAHLPETVESIGLGAYEGCEHLTAITIPFLGQAKDSENRHFGYIFGAELVTDEDKIPLSLATVTLTDDITEIEPYAFYDCVGVVRFNLPAGIKSIGNYAFAGCEKLASVNLSDVITLGKYAFANTAITSVTLPEHITVIPEGLFSESKSLKEVVLPDKLTRISEGAFFGCTSLEYLTLPEALTTVEKNAFANSGLKKLTLSENVSTIGLGALAGCSSLTELSVYFNEEYSALGYLFGGLGITVPESLRTVTVGGATVLTSGAFNSCAYLEEIYLLDGVVSVEAYAFKDCKNLRYVEFPETLSDLHPKAFDGSYKLMEVYCPNAYMQEAIQAACEHILSLGTTEKAPTVTTTDGYKFAQYADGWYLVGYPVASVISVPSSFEYGTEKISAFAIPNNLFRDNSSIKTVILPASVTSIGTRAFYNCRSLESVEINEKSTITEIRNETFGASSSLKSVKFPNTVKAIGSYAFVGCSNLKTVSSSTSLETIGEGAFQSCSSLEKIELYSRVSSIGTNAFYKCSKLYDVYNYSTLELTAGDTSNGYAARYAVKVHSSSSSNASKEVEISGIGVFRNAGTEWLLVKYNGTGERLELKSFKNGSVTVSSYRIAENAFSGNTTLKEIVVGAQVKQIQAGAFSKCTSLAKVDLSSSSIKEIDSETFVGCTELRTVSLPSSVKKIGDRAFAECVRLHSVGMPAYLETIGKGAFYGCQRLVSIEISERVSSIGDDAFADCSMLYEVIDLSTKLDIILGDASFGKVALNAKYVPTYKYDECDKIYQNGCYLIKLGDEWLFYAIDYDFDKTYLELPEGDGADIVLGSNSFYGAKFTGLVLPKTVKTVDKDAFVGVSGFTTLYYKGTKDEYSTVSGSGFLPSERYYYGICVHDWDQWTYKNGAPSIDMCETVTETLAPTCFASGYEITTCPCEGCDYRTEVYIDQLEHEFVDSICTHCKKEQIFLDYTNAQSYVSSGLIALDQFAPDEGGDRFVSENKTNSSTSTFTVNAQGEFMIITFTYGVSSEKGADKLAIKLNGERLATVSGEEKDEMTLTLEAGDVLVFEYSKDFANSEGEDIAYVQNIEIIK
ncbi:MAG: leucine-rich repeat protein [Clostridia bacterium]|nr:leucine-rich repeat protein [Clostridia bacterium]